MFKSRKSLNTLPKGEVQDMSFYYETHREDSIKVINTKYVVETVSLCSGKKHKIIVQPSPALYMAKRSHLLSLAHLSI